MTDKRSMKIRLLPESLPLQNLRYIRENGSEAAQVRRLMTELERTTAIAINPEKAASDVEEFPNHIHYAPGARAKKMLDII